VAVWRCVRAQTHSADPLLALQELAAPVAPEKKLAAAKEPHRSHLRLRCAARGLLLHHLWASSLAKHCARVRALPAPNQAAPAGGGGGGGGGDAGKRRRNEGATAETSGRVFATAHTLKGNAVAAEGDTSRLVVEFRGQAIQYALSPSTLPLFGVHDALSRVSSHGGWRVVLLRAAES